MLTEHTNRVRTSNEPTTTTTAQPKSRFRKIVSFQNNLGANEYRKDRRINGIQLPLHPLQLIGWTTLILFVLSGYILIIPGFQPKFQLPLYATVTFFVSIHLLSHIAALVIDPADIELRRISNSKVVPEFDRSKHLHVIENGRCHLCNIKTSSQRTKHCAVCNKCVEKFDHHCKYLNQCVGKRNYVPFFMCVVSAVAAVLVILAAATIQIVFFYTNPHWLNLWYAKSSIEIEHDNSTTTVDILDAVENDNSTFTTLLNDTLIAVNETLINATTSTALDDESTNDGGGIGLYNTIFLSFLGVIVILAAITAGLLLHLCFFHIYISFLGLTTYEYIRNQRQAVVNGPSSYKEQTIKPSKELFICSKLRPQDNQHRPKTLHCCETTVAEDTNSSRRTTAAISTELSHKAFYMCTILEETATKASDEETRTDVADKSSSAVVDTARTFHCCSEYTHSTQSHKIVKYTEHCTFCSFRLKAAPKKIDHTNKRCCVKSKHHRWRRKWNCCSSVPLSPEDLPAVAVQHGESIRVMSSASVPFHNAMISHAIHQPPRYVQIEVPIENGANVSTTNDFNSFIENNHELMIGNGLSSVPTISSHIDACNSNTNSSSSLTNLAKRTRPKLIRPWPVRLRHVFRMIDRYRRPRCRSAGSTMNSALKQNQVRPLSRSSSSENTITASNNTATLATDSISTKTMTEAQIEVPSAPAPNRRVIKASQDNLQDLAETLSIIQPSNIDDIRVATAAGQQLHQQQQIRRQRRKNNLRNRSPTLSPIHESGLSNPTSPQLTCRHSCSSLGKSTICGSVLSSSTRD